MAVCFSFCDHFCFNFIMDENFVITGGPRQPLIAPPTFFGTVTSSTIKQRGPPPPGHGPTPLRGPRPSHQPPNNGPAGPIVHPSNGPAIPPPAAKTCVILENIPDKTSDSDVAKFLQIPVTKVNSSKLSRKLYLPDNSVNFQISVLVGAVCRRILGDVKFSCLVKVVVCRTLRYGRHFNYAK